MKFWQAVSFSEPEQLVECARIAEEVGFHGVLLSDHLFYPRSLDSGYPYTEDGAPPFTPDTPFPDPFVTIGALLSATTKLRFSMAVYILPLRHPFEVAKATATLAVLSGNRFALGTGAGWMKEEFTQLGVDFHTRGKRYDEMIDVLRLIWSGGMVEHHGDFFDFDPMQMSPAPSEPVPIYIGGASMPALRRAARVGDGWVGNGEDPAKVPEVLDKLSALRRDYGRENEPFEAIVPLTAPASVEQLRELESKGMTSTVSYPFAYTVGPTSTIEQKRQAMETFAEGYIRHLS